MRLPILRTRRLVLRQLAPDDLDVLVRESPAIAGVSAPARRWVEASLSLDPRIGGAWAIVHRLCGRTAGMTIYFAREPGGPAEMTYMLTPRWRGRGLGPEAVGTAICWLFAEVGFERLFADVAVDNRESIRLLQAFGFVPDAGVEAGLTVGLQPQPAARWNLDATTWSQSRRRA